MKFLCLFAIAGLVASALGAPPSQGNDHLKELATKVMHFYQINLPPDHQFDMPDMPAFEFHTDAFDVTIELKNQHVTGISEDVGSVDVDPKTQTASFQLKFPNQTYVGEYTVDGLIFGRNLAGAGNAKIFIKNYVISVTDLVFEEVADGDRKLWQIKSLNMDLDYENLEVTIDGLRLEKLTPEKSAEVVTAELKSFFYKMNKQGQAGKRDQLKHDFNESTY